MLRLAARLLAGLLLLLGATAAPAGAEDSTAPDASTLLRRAESNHDLGIELLASRPEEARAAFARAAADFERVLDGGARNAELHYNLANALLRAGDRGGAIVEYLRARALDPANPEIAANLAFARSQVAGRPSAGDDPSIADRLATWWHVVPMRTRGMLAVGLWIAFWIGLVAREATSRGTSGRVGTVWTIGATAILAASLVLAATVLLDLREQRHSDAVVVVAEQAVLRKGNGDGFEPESAQPLAAGVEARGLERRPGWIRVALEDGRSGWLPMASVESVVEPGG